MGETNLKADILVRSKMVESADGGWQCAGIIMNGWDQSQGGYILVRSKIVVNCQTCRLSLIVGSF